MRDIAKKYGELRLQMEINTRKMQECSEVLFKAFLDYVKARKDDGARVQELLHAFLKEELGLEAEHDRGTILSLVRRFYILAKRRSRNPAEQASLLRYF